MTASTPSPAALSAAAIEQRRVAASRRFGRLQLLRLAGKSRLTMAWRADDLDSGGEVLLVLPRTQPSNPSALALWHDAMAQARRVDHPNLARPLVVGVHEGWPFATYDVAHSSTLAERLGPPGMPCADVAAQGLQLLRGLAFAHDAGSVHHDIQPYLVLVDDKARVQLAGLGVAQSGHREAVAAAPGDVDRRLQRTADRVAVERDVLACGLLMHEMLTGRPALPPRGGTTDDTPQGGSDTSALIDRIAPRGPDVARLPWVLAYPLPDALRATVDRATDDAPGRRFLAARSFANALESWVRSNSAGSGPLELLADRMRVAGALPAMPGLSGRSARMLRMEQERTNELAEVALQDFALSFELLRLANTAQLRSAVLGNQGAVLTVRRAIAMVGLEGIRRAAAALRPWPGPLHQRAAEDLNSLIDRCKLAGRVALAVRPAGYDAEVCWVVTLLQNLGCLALQYHFPEEARQLRKLMLPSPGRRDGDPEEPGMPEDRAVFAVLGVSLEDIGTAVSRNSGMDDALSALTRRHPAAQAVRRADDDSEMLRLVGSCANEAAEAWTDMPGSRMRSLERVAQRYGHLLEFTLGDLIEVLENRFEVPISSTRRMTLDTVHDALPSASSRVVDRSGRQTGHGGWNTR